MTQDKELRLDICVIGAGAGGLAAAAAAAAMSVPVVLIEKGRMGGVSLHSGALPSKALIAAAEATNIARHGVRFGLKGVRPVVDFAAVNSHVRRAIEAVAPQESPERFTGLGVRVIAGTGLFKDPRTVAVGDTTIKARRFIIATGAIPFVPTIPGLADTPYLTSETVFDLAECPRHLIVLGAGRVGLELAQAFRRFGADVTVLEPATPLRHEDRECATIVLDALAREGITVRTGVTVRQVRRAFARVHVVLEDAASSGEAETIEGTHLLLAAGHRPNIEGLDLGAAGIRHEPNGVVVDGKLRTTNKHVYAIGDVIDGPKFTHIANHHANLVVRHALFRVAGRIDRHAMPRVIFTSPELAQVGLLEDEARARAGAIRVLRWAYRENERAQTTAATDGHIKVITDRRGQNPGRHHRRPASQRNHLGLGAGGQPTTQYRRFRRADRALSDLRGGGKTGRHYLFYEEFDANTGASHHRVAASPWLTR